MPVRPSSDRQCEHDHRTEHPWKADAPETAVAEWLRLAGHRPQPSAPRTVQARAAVDAEWQRMVRRRNIRRVLSSLATAACMMAPLIGVTYVLWPPAPAVRATSPTIATLVRLAGPVRVATRGSTAREMRTGERVTAGVAIESGAGGRAAFRLDAQTTLRIDVDTRIVIDSASRLTLERGAVYVDSQGDPDRARLQIQTAHGIVRDIGTQFEVRVVDESLRIRVREGEVQLEPGDKAQRDDERANGRSANGARVEGADPKSGAEDARLAHIPLVVMQAEELRVAAGGGADQRTISLDDTEWAWIDTIAPPFELEGAPLERFLAWVSREQGWTWRYRDDPAKRYGETVVLHGSIDGLTPAQALDAVLPTCGMTYQLRSGQLTISLASQQ